MQLPFVNVRTLNRLGAMRRFRYRGLFGSTRYYSGNRWRSSSTLRSNDPSPNQNHGVLTSRGYVGQYNSLREHGFYDGGLPENGKNYNRMQSIAGAKNITASYKIWTNTRAMTITDHSTSYKMKLFATPLAPNGASQPINRAGSSSFLRNTQLRITVSTPNASKTSSQMANTHNSLASFSFRILIAQVFLPRGTEPGLDFVLRHINDPTSLSAGYFSPYNYANNGRFKIWYDRHIDFPPRYTTCPSSPSSVNEIATSVVCARSVYMGVSIDFNTKVDYLDGVSAATDDIESNAFYLWAIPRCGVSVGSFIPEVMFRSREVSLFYDF